MSDDGSRRIHPRGAYGRLQVFEQDVATEIVGGPYPPGGRAALVALADPLLHQQAQQTCRGTGCMDPPGRSPEVVARHHFTLPVDLAATFEHQTLLHRVVIGGTGIGEARQQAYEVDPPGGFGVVEQRFLLP